MIHQTALALAVLLGLPSFVAAGPAFDQLHKASGGSPLPTPPDAGSPGDEGPGAEPGRPDGRWTAIVARVINEGVQRANDKGRPIVALEHGRHALVAVGVTQGSTFIPHQLWLVLREQGPDGDRLSKAVIDLAGRPIAAFREHYPAMSSFDDGPKPADVREPLEASSDRVARFVKTEQRYWLSDASKGDGIQWQMLAMKAVHRGTPATLPDGTKARMLASGEHRLFVALRETEEGEAADGLVLALVETVEGKERASSVRLELDGFAAEAWRSTLTPGASPGAPAKEEGVEAIDAGSDRVTAFVADEARFWRQQQ